MSGKEISILKSQIAKLEESTFDLDAWKNQTILFLERIFGKESTKVKMIRDLQYVYSSWSLRDTAATGKTRDKDPVKLQAEEILDAAITELELMGLPEEKKDNTKLWESLQDELTGKQIREIEALIAEQRADNVAKIADIIKTVEKENLANAIARILNT
jgi:hypothetical protein